MVRKLRRMVALHLVIAIITSIAAWAPDHTGGAQSTDDFGALRARWTEMLTGGEEYNPSDPSLAPPIATITSRAKNHWKGLNKASGRSYLWRDLDTQQRSSAVITENYERIFDMALAYRTEGSALKGNPRLLNDMRRALDWMYLNQYNERSVSFGNWWDWEIGAPQALADTVILLYPKLAPKRTAKYMNAIDHFASDPATLRENTQGKVTKSTGYNLASKALVVALRAIIVEDRKQLGAARDALSHPENSIFKYVSGKDGFYKDGSFIFHDYLPYTGDYGSSLLAKAVNLMYLLAHSEFAVTDPARENMYQWVYDSFEPVMYDGALMSMVRGRGISRARSQEHAAGHALTATIVRMSQLATLDSRRNDAATLRSMVKGWVERDTHDDFFKASTTSVPVAAETQSILDDTDVRQRVMSSGYSQFSAMDRAVLRRPEFAFGISMYSARTQNYEQINGLENLKGWHTADGMTYLYNGDLAQFDANFWPTVDASRLPGTTVRRGVTKDAVRFSDRHWAGGTDLQGKFGVTGMALHPTGQNLSAKKSWFMFNDEVVALGADVDGNGKAPVETTIENRKLSGSNTEKFKVDGDAEATSLPWRETMNDTSWAHLEGAAKGSDIGYYFPGKANVEGLRELRKGRWDEINNRYDTPTSPKKGKYLTLWMDHGSKPDNAKYSYVLLPGKSAPETNEYASDPDITVVENSARAQAVKEEESGILGVNFWSDTVDTVGTVTVNRKASVMKRELPKTLEISVSDPTQLNTGSIDVEIARSAKDVISANPRITVVQYRPTIKLRVDVDGARGRSIKAKFALDGPARENPSAIVPRAAESTVIVDNTDPGFSRDKEWNTSAGDDGFHGRGYAHDGNSSADQAQWAMWTPYISESGTYDVYLKWPAHSNRPDAAPVVVSHRGGTSKTTVNQQKNGGKWVRLGTYKLKAGTSSHVKINAGDDGYTVADAVKFVRK